MILGINILIINCYDKNMNSNQLKNTIQKSIDDFSATWSSVDEFYIFAKQYIELTHKTYDGWYCIKNESETDVYYQERGIKHWYIFKFSDYTKAILFCISCSQDLAMNIKEDYKIKL